jgi:hypothetical protein
MKRLSIIAMLLVCGCVLFVVGRLSVESQRPGIVSPHGDVATEIAAYDKAADLFRSSEIGRRAGQVAPYSPQRVRLLAENLYAVTVVYEGRDSLGELTALNVRMNIRCQNGLCFFTTAE